MDSRIEAVPKPILIERTEAALHLILNRPEAINSLNLEMVRTITAEIEKVKEDPAVKLIVLSGIGPRGFCAGGDVKILAKAFQEQNIEPALQFLREEYNLDYAIYRYPKPVVIFAHGITMGGGLGLSAGADVIVADETTRMAMPETRIGLFPDVGATGWLFQKCGKRGYPEFLGVTGYELIGTECVRIGLATHVIPSVRFEEAINTSIRHSPLLPLERTAASARLEQIFRPFTIKDMPEKLEMDAWVEEYFADKTSVVDLLENLRACSSQSTLCEGVFSRLSERSPSAVVATLKCLRHDKGANLKDVFESNLKVVRYLMAQHDFKEGVRARLIDKDDRPRWDPADFKKAAKLEHLVPLDRT